MEVRILHTRLRTEHDVVSLRQRARQICTLLGFSVQHQVRVATAVSESARLLLNQAQGGRAEFTVELQTASPCLAIHLHADGPPPPRLSGDPYTLDPDLAGVQRLMDDCLFNPTGSDGTSIILKKRLDNPLLGPQDIERISARLLAEPAATELSEMQLQNHELLQALAEVEAKQQDLSALTRELEDTNRGMVALYAELEEHADRIRKADEMKSRFLSNTSHELRTPLGSIRALARLLLDRVDGELSPEQEKQVALIEKTALDLSELVNDLLDLAKIEAGKVEVSAVEFEVDALFSALRGTFRPLVQKGDVELIFESCSPIPSAFHDEGKITQILRNLISNAIKFTPQGSIRVGCAYEAANEQLLFSVSDSGIGIAEKDLALIFEEFAQVENAHQKHVKGTGLGLPLCRKLAALMGGSISVSSREGEGSTFVLHLPLMYGTGTAAMRAAVPPAQTLNHGAARLS